MKKRRVTDLSIEELATLAAEAGREAVEESRRLGLPVTGTKDGRHIMDLSMEERANLFAQAGREAVERSRNAGLPVTGMKNGWIVRIYPDGHEEVIQKTHRVPINVGPGWLPIVYRLIVSLAQLPDPPDIEEIKNKNGELRVDLKGYQPEGEALIGEADEEAARTCEMCGQPGELREQLPWMQVLCDQHYKDRQ